MVAALRMEWWGGSTNFGRGIFKCHLRFEYITHWIIYMQSENLVGCRLSGCYTDNSEMGYDLQNKNVVPNQNICMYVCTYMLTNIREHR